ncbi:MAG: enoyl-CoA hydratase/isomerase family protein [Chloroflexota bacterium]
MNLDSMFITHDGAIATLHLNRSERLNAFGMRGTVELNTAADYLAQHDATRVVVVTGEGRSFSTGIDLKELSAGEIDMAYHHHWEGALRKFEVMNKVVVAAINGWCLGGGLQLALACDVRVAVESAMLGLPAVKEGLLPGMGVYRLPRAIGYTRAKRFILSGELVNGREAERIGMVDYCVSADEFAAKVAAVSQSYLNIPWASVLLSKQMTNRAFDLPFDEFLQEYFAAQTEAMQSDDHFAAMAAYRAEQNKKTSER